jgi:hypothetical protein
MEAPLNIIFHTIWSTLYEAWDQVTFDLKMETVCSFESLVSKCKNTLCHIPEDRKHEVSQLSVWPGTV